MPIWGVKLRVDTVILVSDISISTKTYIQSEILGGQLIIWGFENVGLIT